MASVSEKRKFSELSNPRNRARLYQVTINNPTAEEEKSFVHECMMRQWDYIFQIEKGAEGTEHIQGMIGYKNQIKWVVVKEAFPRAHLEFVRGKKAMIAYCQKAETRVRGPFSNKPEWLEAKARLKDVVRDKGPYEWQKIILNIIETEKSDRNIHWVWEDEGAVGKTALAKHVCLNYKALYLGGRAANCKYAIAQYLGKGQGLDVVIFDYVRTMEQFISYEAIESVKNGIFFSGKYEASMVIFDSPVVICFANFKPNMLSLSHDRWIIHHLADKVCIGDSIYPAAHGDKIEPALKKSRKPELRRKECEVPDNFVVPIPSPSPSPPLQVWSDGEVEWGLELGMCLR